MRNVLATGADPHLRAPYSLFSEEGENSTLIMLCLRSPRKEQSYLEENHVECVRMLLEAGADPCAVDEGGYFNGCTTLYFAALNNHHESLALLLEAGAGALVDTKLLDVGWTPLAQAAQCAHLECVELLLAAGADVELRVQNGAIDVSPLECSLRAPGRGCSQSSSAPARRSRPTLRTPTCSRSATPATGGGTNARAGRASQKSSPELFFHVCPPTRSRTSSISHSTRAATSLRQTTPYSEERYPNPESTARHASDRPTGGRAVAAVRTTDGDAPP